MEIEQEAKFVTWSKSVHFIRLVNSLYYGVNVHNETVDKMWGYVKTYRVKWLNGEKENATKKCNYGRVDDSVIDVFLDSQEDRLNITGLPTSQPIYRKQVSDYLLLSAAQMYMYLANCPDKHKIAWQTLYSEPFLQLFNKNDCADFGPYQQSCIS